MRYRRLGNTDLVVSEVGLGTWTLVSDWWGQSEDPAAIIAAALDAGITFIDTAPVYGSDGAGETLPSRRPRHPRRDRAHDQVRLRHQRGTAFPGSVGTAARLATGVGPRAVRRLAAPARHRVHRPVPAAQHAHRPDPRRRALGDARRPQDGGQGARARRRARARDRLGRRRQPCDRRSPDRLAADRVQRARTGTGPDVRGPAERGIGRGRAHRACTARVRHALGQGHARHRVRPEGPSVAPQPRQHARQLREGRDAVVPVGAGDRPHDRPGRDRGDPRQPGVHDRAADRCSPSPTSGSTPRPPTSR